MKLYKHNNFRCHYLTEKEERNKAREKVWTKIELVDDVIKKTYDTLEEFQREIRSSDGIQDKHIEELKAMIQEIAASQELTDNELQQVKTQIGTLRSDIADLKHELGNGFPEKLGNSITDRLFKLLELMNQNNYTIKKTEIETENDIKIVESLRKKMLLEKRFELLTRLLTAGGIIYLLIDKVF